MKQTLTAFLLGLGVSLTAQAAPLGVTPGRTQLPQAKTLLGEPQATLISEARYQFAAPAGSGYATVELYIGRRSQVVELALYNLAAATDAATIKTQLKQKDADLRYTLSSGETAEVFLAIKARVILNKEGKVRAVEYLSDESLRVLLSEVAPLTADRSTPAGAYRALVAALYSNKEADLTASLGGAKSAAGLEITALQKARPALLFSLDNSPAAIPTPKPKAKDALVKVTHPLFGVTEFVFIPTDKGWLLSQINGLASPLEKTPSTPRAALALYLKSLYAKPVSPAPKAPAPPEVSAMSAWGAEWHAEVEKLSVTSIALDGSKATVFLAGGDKAARVSCVVEAKSWRVTEIKPEK